MSNKNEVIVIDPKDYGLEKQNVVSIEEAFAPKIAEREALVEVYTNIISKEMSPELAIEAKEARLKLVKVRTGIATIHKTQKSFFLAAGRFVDAWKNKETEPVSQMEEGLKAIEDHFENIEREKLAQLQKERVAELSKYVDGADERELSGMDEDVWLAFLETKKKAHEDRLKQAEEERLERERKEREEKEENERIRLENEKLKKEREEKEKEHSIKKLKRKGLAIDFLIDNDFQIVDNGVQANGYHHFIGSLHYSNLESDNELELFKSDVLKTKKIEEDKIENERILKKEREEREKAEKELKRKEFEERKKKENEEKLAQQEFEKGDADKKRDLVSELEALLVKYDNNGKTPFKAKTNQARYEEAKTSIMRAIEAITK